MSNLRNCVELGPELVGVEGINAKRWGKKYLNLFVQDAGKETNLFDLQPGETIEDRLDVLNGLYMAKGAQRVKVHYWICLLTLAAYSYAITKGQKELEPARNTLAGYLSTKESQFPEIAAVYSVAQASTQGQWG